MMDSFRPLKVAKAILPYEDKNYIYSWIEGGSGFSPPTS